MNQAARCPNCRTVFRVQPQQLQASGGWARCGQCGEVFNALQALVAVPPPVPGAAAPRVASGRPAGTMALDSNPPPASALYRRAEPGSAATPRADAPMPPSAAASLLEATARPAPVPRQVAAPAPTPVPLEPSAAAPATAPVDAAASASFLASLLPAETEMRTAAEAAAPAPKAAPIPPASLPPEVVEQASFLQAGAPVRETTDTQRTWWIAAAMLLALAALLQALLIARPALSARYPAARTLLQPLCALVRCNAEAAPRHLAALAVESSALARLSGDGQRYRLSLVLRNRDTQALRWPAIDLRLTDAQGVLLVRKVLRVRDLGATTAALPAGQEQPLQAVLDMGEQPVAGYSVELFYP